MSKRKKSDAKFVWLASEVYDDIDQNWSGSGIGTASTLEEAKKEAMESIWDDASFVVVNITNAPAVRYVIRSVAEPVPVDYNVTAGQDD